MPSEEKEQSNFDVVIIGAGISGLSAAKLLTAQGLSVIVLEARDRVGGRTYTIKGPEFGYTDLGGAYAGPTQRRLFRMAKEFDIKFYNVSTAKKTVLKVKNKKLVYDGLLPTISNPYISDDLNKLGQTIGELSAKVPPEAPWKAPKAAEWDLMSYKDFLDKNCSTSLAYEVYRLVCRSVLCAEPHEVSLLSFLFYMASGYGPERVMNVENGAQEKKFRGGSMQLSERLAECVEGKVKLNHVVIKVEQTEDSVTVQTLNGAKFTGRYLISAMPLTLLNRVQFDPPLPSMKQQMIQRLPMGSIIKTMTFYKTRFWQEKGFNGEMMTDAGPIIYCIDDTKDDGSFPCIMGFAVADNCRALSKLTMNERKKLITKHYADVFGLSEFLNPTYYIDHDWSGEEFSGGCYVCNFPTGTLTRYGEEMRKPFKRTFFAGTDTAAIWAGYMDGAIEAGERAAREALCDMGKISASDVWQEEPPVEGFPEPPFPTPSCLEGFLPSASTVLTLSLLVIVVILICFPSTSTIFTLFLVVFVAIITWLLFC